MNNWHWHMQRALGPWVENGCSSSMTYVHREDTGVGVPWTRGMISSTPHFGAGSIGRSLIRPLTYMCGIVNIKRKIKDASSAGLASGLLFWSSENGLQTRIQSPLGSASVRCDMIVSKRVPAVSISLIVILLRSIIGSHSSICRTIGACHFQQNQGSAFCLEPIKKN
jgi:hypothetical protein